MNTYTMQYIQHTYYTVYHAIYFVYTSTHDVGDGLSVHEKTSDAEGALERPPAVAPQVEHELVRPLRLHLNESVLQGVRHDRVEVAESSVSHLVLSLVLSVVLSREIREEGRSNKLPSGGDVRGGGGGGGSWVASCAFASQHVDRCCGRLTVC